jgi:hypothetical protein
MCYEVQVFQWSRTRFVRHVQVDLVSTFLANEDETFTAPLISAFQYGGPWPLWRAEKAECRAKHEMGFGAGDGSRTRDIQLGRLTLYRLSYSRPFAFVC